jgi:2-hydroxyglutaryl-CoA dehydratase, D-component
MEVFCTSPWVPPEWIRAHGLEPRGVWLARDFACEPLSLAAGVCAFANAAVRLAERQSQSAVIFTTHCDQLRRGFDTVAAPPTNLDSPESSRRDSLSPSEGERAGVRGPFSPWGSGMRDASKGQGALSRLFLFNLPVTWQTPVAERIFSDELRRLGRFLIGLGGHPPAAEELSQLMAQYSQARRRLLAAASWCPARAYAEAVARFHLDGLVHLPERGCRQPQRAGSVTGGEFCERSAATEPAAAEDRRTPGAGFVPLALVGGPLPQAQMPLLDAIEQAGGRVVLNATEAGERSLWSGSPLNQGQLDLPLLARGWLANCVDVFQRPNTRLYDWLRERLTARKVRGIVLWHYVGCDLWRAEAQPMREAFGLPVLLLDADEAMPRRNTGRLQAFLESLR